MSDITRFFLGKTKVIVDDVEYYELEFFDSMDGQVIRVMAPISENVTWVKPRPTNDDGQKAIEEAIKKKTEIKEDTSNLEDLQNAL